MPSKIKYIFLTFLIFFIFPQKVNAQVVINEFQISPDQWIELYNKSESDIDISGWIIDDSGGTEKYDIPNSTILKSKKCISFQSGKFNWNQSEDVVKLLNSTSITQEEYPYTIGPASNISIGRVVDGEGELIALTTQTKNNYNSTGESCLAPTPSPSPTPVPTDPPTQAPTAAPTASPTVKPTPTKTGSPKPTPKPTPTEKPTEESLVLEPQVLSLSTIESSPEPEIREKKKTPILAIILITLGVGFLGYGGFLLYNQKYGKNKEIS